MSDLSLLREQLLRTRTWAAMPGSQSFFLSCPVSEALFEGTRGPGKTEALLVDFAQFTGLGLGAAWQGILFRETYPQLADVIKKSKKLFHNAFPEARWVGSPHYTWTWPTGEQLLLRHMRTPDDYWDYHGHEYPWQGWEELTNWHTLECYDVMKACWRSSHPYVPRRLRSTCNPYGVGHNAVKARFIDPAPRGTIIVDKYSPAGRVAIHGDISENLVLLAADPSYLANLDAIEDPNRRAAWRFGSWDITAGGMFDDLWSRQFHVCKPFKIPPSWRLERCHDWGQSRPSATGWFAQSSGEHFAEVLEDGTETGRTLWYPRGHSFLVDELYIWTGVPNKGRPTASEKLGELIVAQEKRRGWHERVKAGPADASIFDAKPGERSIADKYADKGARFVPSVKTPGSRVRGWQLCRDKLEASIVERGHRQEEPGFTVFDRCVQFIRTVPSAPRDPENLDDLDTESEDHLADLWRYHELQKKPFTSVESLRA